MRERSAAVEPSRVRVRRARVADLAALIELEQRSFATDRLSARQLRRHVGHAGAALLVADRAGVPVGAALVFFRRGSRVARLYSIAVAEHARGTGVGQKLLAACERAAAAQGCDAIRLEVRAANPRARRLYERAGYRAFATREGYYEDGADAVRYEKRIGRNRRPTPAPAAASDGKRSPRPGRTRSR